MHTQSEVLLCHVSAGPDRYHLYAVLDELALTYGVIQRAANGRERALRRHVASLSDARRWACAFRDRDPATNLEYSS
jgi:hypothetical protein